MKILMILFVLMFAVLSFSQSFTWNDPQTDSWLTLYTVNGDTLVKGVFWRNTDAIVGKNIAKAEFCEWFVNEFVTDTTRINQIIQDAANIDAAITRLQAQKVALTEEYNWRTDYKALILRAHNGIKQHLDCTDNFEAEE